MASHKDVNEYNIDIEKFILVFEEGYSRKDMAEIFGITEGVVRILWKKLDLSRKGKPRSKRHSEKISNAAKERYESGFQVWNLGIPCDVATKNKISESKKGTKPWNYGIPCSPEVKEKIRNKNRGRKHSTDTKRKQLLNTPRGEEHWNWQGGLTALNMSLRKMPEYIKWRDEVYKRDSYTCCLCGIVGTILNADHIKPFSFLIRENNIQNIEQARNCEALWDTENGRTLCISCHRKTDTYGGNSK